MDDIFLLSLTHETAPLALRERLALDQHDQQRLLDEAHAFIDECVAVVTCNRTEIYAVSDSPHAQMKLAELLAGYGELELAVLRQHLRCLRGVQAVQHLFRVAAGLDSLVIGEPQILGQVRRAADLAREGDHSGPILERLFNYALVAGKRARRETAIGQGAGSISHAAVELARATLGELTALQGLVVGLGDMGQLVARNLAAHGIGDLRLCNRSPERSAGIARQLSASVVDWEQLDEALASADICILATAAREPLLTRERLAPITSHRAGRPLLLIDIAVPRNAEHTAGDLPGVHLHDLDSLQEIRAKNLRSRERTIPLVDTVVDEEVGAFREWYRGRASAPVIQSLRERAESVREQEVRRALGRLGHLNDRDREVVLALSHAITNKLLHEPVTRLKRSAAPQKQAQALIDLFGLEDFALEPERMAVDDD